MTSNPPLAATEILKFLGMINQDLERIKKRNAQTTPANANWSYGKPTVTVLSDKVRVTSTTMLRDAQGKIMDAKLEDWNFKTNANAKRFLKSNKFVGESLDAFKDFFAPAAQL